MKICKKLKSLPNQTDAFQPEVDSGRERPRMSKYNSGIVPLRVQNGYSYFPTMIPRQTNETAMS